MATRVVYQRENLYDEVWKEPVRKVARRYGVSDVAVHKICRKLQIPTPPPGYWARVEAGQQPKRPPLPALKPGEPEEFTGVTGLQQIEDVLEMPYGPLTEVDAAKAREVDDAWQITVAEVLTEPHPLIAGAAKAYQADPAGGLATVPLGGRPVAGVMVSPGSLDRALRILDALCKAMDRRQASVVVKPPEYPYSSPDPTRMPEPHLMLVGGKVRFSLTEDVEWVALPLTPQQERENRLSKWGPRHHPKTIRRGTGRLILAIEGGWGYEPGIQRSWRDAKLQRVERCLNRFLLRAIDVADADRKRAEELRQRHLAEEQAAERTAQRRRQQTAERRRRRDLAGRLAAWASAKEIRIFLNEVSSHFDKSAANTEHWIAWVRSHAELLESAACSPIENSLLAERNAALEAGLDLPREERDDPQRTVPLEVYEQAMADSHSTYMRMLNVYRYSR